MEKNTIYAIILSIIIISLGFYIQTVLFPPPVPERPIETGRDISQEQMMRDPANVNLTAVSAMTSREIDPDLYREVRLETEVFEVVFSNLGGTIKSLRLRNHFDGDEMLEMINTNSDMVAFNIYMGDFTADPLNVYFDTRVFTQGISTITEFTKDIEIPSITGESTPLFIMKRYIFKPSDYMIELQIQIINRNNQMIPLDNNGFAYTLGFGPQIGPRFERIDGRREFRRFLINTDRRREVSPARNETEVKVHERINWAAISGRYFAVIGIPDHTLYTTVFSNRAIDGFEEGSRLFFSRPVIRSSATLDTFRFFIGPKSAEILRSHNHPDRNGFRTSDLNLERILDTIPMLGWLQEILKVLLDFFYGIVPNYGVAIIMVTIFVRLLMFPLTHKAFKASSKMAALSPKMQELREKYKGNPQKMNQEMSNLYRTAGVNPLGGCLPLLLQMPIFIALYGLLSTHFELRGAAFMLWITDLSAPDSIYNFAPASIPLIGSDIRMLPILMVVTQIFSTKVMQTPASANNAQMKLMMYMLPAIFLFILYDAPSGLLLYWTMTNFLTIIQQIIVNRVVKRKKSA